MLVRCVGRHPSATWRQEHGADAARLGDAIRTPRFRDAQPTGPAPYRPSGIAQATHANPNAVAEVEFEALEGDADASVQSDPVRQPIARAFRRPPHLTLFGSPRGRMRMGTS